MIIVLVDNSYIFGRNKLYFWSKMVIFLVENGYIFGRKGLESGKILSVIFLIVKFGCYIISVIFSPPKLRTGISKYRRVSFLGS